MKNPIITLLTDFGTKDHYVASMKGVILRINPSCTIIDISHDIEPQDIIEGAFLLGNSFSYFPKGTIHLSVVDPGVGSPRNPVLVVTPNYFFIGPDNGFFEFVKKKEKLEQTVVLTNGKYFLPVVSQTFHGRDIFAPVAAHLSLGIKPSAFGHKAGPLKELGMREPIIRDGKLLGEILYIDHFGNLISNIDEKTLFQFARGRFFVIRIRRRSIRHVKKGYWEGRGDDPIGLIGSSSFLEVSVREGSAQKTLKAKRGDPIVISTSY
jgi:S-adenosylmethionine hydrolase